ncbi:MAG: ABC transporter permease [Thermaerobacter sp.]|nr:ABC transporter permease [Thermaerobacter sp.]
MRALAVAIRIWQQVLRDRRTLALFFVAPVLLLTVLQVTLTSPTITPSVAVRNLPPGFQTVLKRYVQVAPGGTVDGSLVGEGGGHLRLTIDSVSPTVIARTRQGVLAAEAVYNQRAMAKSLNQVLSLLPSRPPNRAGFRPSLLQPAVVSYKYAGGGYSTFNQTAPALMALFIFFFVFLVSGISFLRERVQGTLERLKVSPIRGWEIMAGYLSGFGLIAILQTLLLQWFATQVLTVPSSGAVGLALVIDLLLAFIALSTGMVLSLFARTEFQVMQFIPLVIIPQIVFSGLFPLDTAPAWVKVLSKLFPVTYGIRGLRAVMLQNGSLPTVEPEIAVLVLFFVLLAGINLVLLRKPRVRARAEQSK